MVRRIKNKDYVEVSVSTDLLVLFCLKKDFSFNVIQSHGVPQFFGIYYAMGIALVLEGFMSSFYHICPSNANFQFGK